MPLYLYLITKPHLQLYRASFNVLLGRVRLRTYRIFIEDSANSSPVRITTITTNLLVYPPLPIVT